MLSYTAKQKSRVGHTDPQSHHQSWGYWADRIKLKGTEMLQTFFMEYNDTFNLHLYTHLVLDSSRDWRLDLFFLSLLEIIFITSAAKLNSMDNVQSIDLIMVQEGTKEGREGNIYSYARWLVFMRILPSILLDLLELSHWRERVHKQVATIIHMEKKRLKFCHL